MMIPQYLMANFVKIRRRIKAQIWEKKAPQPSLYANVKKTAVQLIGKAKMKKLITSSLQARSVFSLLIFNMEGSTVE